MEVTTKVFSNPFRSHLKKNMKDFKKYKKIVESTVIKGKDFTLRLELSDIAKWEGEMTIHYKYNAVKELQDGSKVSYPVVPPICIPKDYNILDGRNQLNKKELLKLLDESVFGRK